jgi:hypothetical protein
MVRRYKVALAGLGALILVTSGAESALQINRRCQHWATTVEATRSPAPAPCTTAESSSTGTADMCGLCKFGPQPCRLNSDNASRPTAVITRFYFRHLLARIWNEGFGAASY